MDVKAEIELKKSILKEKTDGTQSKEFQDKAGPAVVTMSIDDCKAACKSIGVVYKDGYEKRVLRYTCSTSSVDRSGDVIKQEGWDLENFKKNPVIMGFHDYNTFPVGNALYVGVQDGKLKMEILFADKDVNEDADKAFRMASSGFMKAGSVGFNPSKYHMATPEEVKELGMSQHGVMFEAQELLEYSVCGVPCNADAVQESINKGIVAKSDVEKYVSKEVFGELKEKEVEKETNITAFTPEQMEEIEKLINTTSSKTTVEKAGAVLSKKNKDTISKAVEALAPALEALKSLLELSEPSKEDTETELSKDNKDSSENKSLIIDIDLDTIDDVTDDGALYSEDNIINLDLNG